VDNLALLSSYQTPPLADMAGAELVASGS